MDNIEFKECLSTDEFEKAKFFRQHYFFGKVNLQDPYLWTFKHDQHKHFVAYLNQEIIDNLLIIY